VVRGAPQSDEQVVGSFTNLDNGLSRWCLEFHVSVPRRPATLWTIGPVSCTCLTLDSGQVEICLVSNYAVIERRLFSDTEEATAYALEKMHAYRIH
jgi:hypothetical protein